MQATTLLTLFLGAVAAVVLLSFTFAWYEAANARPQLLAGRFRPASLRLAASLLGSEFACLVAAVLLHPLGWFGSREPLSGPAGAPPVILLHGLFHNRACWLWMKRSLRSRGVHNLHTLNLPPWKDIETLTERLAKKVDEMRLASGCEQVQLVGHSLGGIIARNYLQLRGGAPKVERCVLLAAPNDGSKLAPFALSPLGKLLMPGSEFLQRLAAAPLPPNVCISTIYSRHDNIVLPPRSSRLEGAANIELECLGHTGLLFAPRAAGAIRDALIKEQP